MAMAGVGQENGTPIGIRHGSGQPIVLIHGDADRILPSENTAKRLPPLIRGLRDGGGGPHNAAWTHPDVVNPDLLDFVKG
jgi:non-heme chloroperoxidase